MGGVVKSIFGGSDPDPLPPPPTVDDKDVKGEKDKERKRLASRRGLRSTILTGPEGLNTGDTGTRLV